MGRQKTTKQTKQDISHSNVIMPSEFWSKLSFDPNQVLIQIEDGEGRVLEIAI